MISRFLVAAWIALAFAGSAAAQSEVDRDRTLAISLGLDRFGAQPPRAHPIRTPNGGFQYDITDFAYDLLKGSGGRHDAYEWLRQIYGHDRPFALELRSALGGDEQILPPHTAQKIRAFHARDDVRTIWSRRDTVAAGTMLVYLLPRSGNIDASLWRELERSCALRACIVLQIDPTDQEAVDLALGRIDLVIERIGRHGNADPGLPRPTLSIIDGVVHMEPSPIGNYWRIHDAFAVFWAHDSFVTSDYCGLIVTATAWGRPVSASHRCMMTVVP